MVEFKVTEQNDNLTFVLNEDTEKKRAKEDFAEEFADFVGEVHSSFHSLLTCFTRLKYSQREAIQSFFGDDYTTVTSEDFFGSYAVFLHHCITTKECLLQKKELSTKIVDGTEAKPTEELAENNENVNNDSPISSHCVDLGEQALTQFNQTDNRQIGTPNSSSETKSTMSSSDDDDIEFVCLKERRRTRVSVVRHAQRADKDSPPQKSEIDDDDNYELVYDTMEKPKKKKKETFAAIAENVDNARDEKSLSKDKVVSNDQEKNNQIEMGGIAAKLCTIPLNSSLSFGKTRQTPSVTSAWTVQVSIEDNENNNASKPTQKLVTTPPTKSRSAAAVSPHPWTSPDARRKNFRSGRELFESLSQDNSGGSTPDERAVTTGGPSSRDLSKRLQLLSDIKYDSELKREEKLKETAATFTENTASTKEYDVDASKSTSKTRRKVKLKLKSRDSSSSSSDEENDEENDEESVNKSQKENVKEHFEREQVVVETKLRQENECPDIIFEGDNGAEISDFNNYLSPAPPCEFSDEDNLKDAINNGNDSLIKPKEQKSDVESLIGGKSKLKVTVKEEQFLKKENSTDNFLSKSPSFGQRQAILAASRSPQLKPKFLNLVKEKLVQEQSKPILKRKITKHEQPLYALVMKNTLAEYQRQKANSLSTDDSVSLSRPARLEKSFVVQNARSSDSICKIQNNSLVDKDLSKKESQKTSDVSIDNSQAKIELAEQKKTFLEILTEKLLEAVPDEVSSPLADRKGPSIYERALEKSLIDYEASTQPASANEQSSFLGILENNVSELEGEKDGTSTNNTFDAQDEPLCALVVKSALKWYRKTQRKLLNHSSSSSSSASSSKHSSHRNSPVVDQQASSAETASLFPTMDESSVLETKPLEYQADSINENDQSEEPSLVSALKEKLKSETKKPVLKRNITKHEEPLYALVMKDCLSEYQRQRALSLESQDTTTDPATNTEPRFIDILTQKLIETVPDVHQGEMAAPSSSPLYESVIEESARDYNARKMGVYSNEGFVSEEPNFFGILEDNFEKTNLKINDGDFNSLDEPVCALVVKSALKWYRKSVKLSRAREMSIYANNSNIVDKEESKIPVNEQEEEQPLESTHISQTFDLTNSSSMQNQLDISERNEQMDETPLQAQSTTQLPFDLNIGTMNDTQERIMSRSPSDLSLTSAEVRRITGNLGEEDTYLPCRLPAMPSIPSPDYTSTAGATQRASDDDDGSILTAKQTVEEQNSCSLKEDTLSENVVTTSEHDEREPIEKRLRKESMTHPYHIERPFWNDETSTKQTSAEKPLPQIAESSKHLFKSKASRKNSETAEIKLEEKSAKRKSSLKPKDTDGKRRESDGKVSFFKRVEVIDEAEPEKLVSQAPLKGSPGGTTPFKKRTSDVTPRKTSDIRPIDESIFDRADQQVKKRLSGEFLEVEAAQSEYLQPSDTSAWHQVKKGQADGLVAFHSNLDPEKYSNDKEVSTTKEETRTETSGPKADNTSKTLAQNTDDASKISTIKDEDTSIQRKTSSLSESELKAYVKANDMNGAEMSYNLMYDLVTTTYPDGRVTTQLVPQGEGSRYIEELQMREKEKEALSVTKKGKPVFPDLPPTPPPNVNRACKPKKKATTPIAQEYLVKVSSGDVKSPEKIKEGKENSYIEGNPFHNKAGPKNLNAPDSYKEAKDNSSIAYETSAFGSEKGGECCNATRDSDLCVDVRHGNDLLLRTIIPSPDYNEDSSNVIANSEDDIIQQVGTTKNEDSVNDMHGMLERSNNDTNIIKHVQSAEQKSSPETFASDFDDHNDTSQKETSRNLNVNVHQKPVEKALMKLVVEYDNEVQKGEDEQQLSNNISLELETTDAKALKHAVVKQPTLGPEAHDFKPIARNDGNPSSPDNNGVDNKATPSFVPPIPDRSKKPKPKTKLLTPSTTTPPLLPRSPRNHAPSPVVVAQFRKV